MGGWGSEMISKTIAQQTTMECGFVEMLLSSSAAADFKETGEALLRSLEGELNGTTNKLEFKYDKERLRNLNFEKPLRGRR